MKNSNSALALAVSALFGIGLFWVVILFVVLVGEGRSFVSAGAATLKIYSAFPFNDLGLNLMSELVGIGITYFVIDALLKRRDKHHWAPARQLIAKQVAKTYSVCLNCAYQLFLPLLRPVEMQSHPMPPFESRIVFLKQVEKQIKRLQTVIDLNNAALNAPLMSSVSTFLDAAESLETRMRFLVTVHHPQNLQVDYVYDDVPTILRRLEAAVSSFKSDYPDQWKDRTVVFQGLKSADETIMTLSEAEHPRLPVFFSPERYVYSAGRRLFVFDFETMRRIPTKDMKTGVTVQVFQAE
jgi:hypothetical protein